jgi:DNA-binding CsgD family transcriptional regulator
VALLERDGLIARLRAAATQAQAGHGSVVLVSGEAGAAGPFRLHAAGDLGGAAQAWLDIGRRYEAAEAWAASADEADLRRLRELGVRAIPRRPGRSVQSRPHGLTRREAEVLEWVARGRTDPEIAAVLHLSVRTVEHHVAAILRKTGAANRRSLLSS